VDEVILRRLVLAERRPDDAAGLRFDQRTVLVDDDRHVAPVRVLPLPAPYLLRQPEHARDRVMGVGEDEVAQLEVGRGLARLITLHSKR